MKELEIFHINAYSNVPKGSYDNPYTIREFEAFPLGTWPGGWVETLGYVESDTLKTPTNGYYYCDSSENTGYSYYEYASEPTTSSTFKKDSAAMYILSHANSASEGQCAKYVRLALEAGGFDTSGHPKYAKDYDTFLVRKGWHILDPSSYSSQVGDICVHKTISGHPYGHIAMNAGSYWVSDFIQSDMHGGSDYRRSSNYLILRWPR